MVGKCSVSIITISMGPFFNHKVCTVWIQAHFNHIANSNDIALSSLLVAENTFSGSIASATIAYVAGISV